MDGIIALQQAQNYAVRGVPYCTLPKGWDAGWKAALAAQSTAPVNVAFFGDSITAGKGATDWLANGWVGQVRAGLLARSGYVYGGDYVSVASDGMTGYTSSASTPYTTLFGGNVFEIGYGRGANPPASTSVNGVYTTKATCTAFDIIYLDWQTGSWTYSVDGGANVTVNTSTAGGGLTSLVKKVSVTGLTAGTHTVSLGNSNSGNSMMILGIAEYSSANGLRFARHGFSGIKGCDLTTAGGASTGTAHTGTPSGPNDKIKQMQGPTSAGAATGFGFPAQPHLAFLAYGINDCTTGAPLWMYRDMLSRSIHAIRRGQPNASIVLVAFNYPDAISSDNTGGRGFDWHRYKGVMADMARIYNCAFIDIDSRWGELAVTNGFTAGSGDLHPTNAGHLDIANTILGVI